MPDSLPDASWGKLVEDPDFYVSRISYQDGLALVQPMTEAGYSASPFLDEHRIIAASSESWAAPLDRLLALPFAARPCRHIFHMGHVGSTLVSRMLATSPDVLALREPQALNTVAHQTKLPAGKRSPAFDAQTHLESVVACLARTYRDDQVSLLKATTVANNLMEPILRQRPDDRVVFIHVSPETYVASMVAFRAELVRFHRQTYNFDVMNVFGQAGGSLSIESIGELAAVTWAVFACHYAGARAAAPDRSMALDFDALIVEPDGAMTALAGFLSLTNFDEDKALAAMAYNAKDTAKPYGADARRHQVDQRLAAHGDDVTKGMALLDRLERDGPAHVSEAIRALRG